MPGDSDGDAGNGAAGRGNRLPATPPVKRKFSYYISLILVCLLIMIVIFISYPVAKTNPDVRLVGTNWSLVSIRDTTGILIPVQSGTEITAVFGGDRRVSGFAGCNHYTASYTIHDTALTIRDVAATKMYCTTPGVMLQESAFLSGLPDTRAFQAGGSTLKFLDAGGKTVLVFQAV